MPQKDMRYAFVRRWYSGLSSITDTPYLFPRKWKLFIFWLLVGVKWYNKDFCATGGLRGVYDEETLCCFLFSWWAFPILAPDVPQTCVPVDRWSNKRVTTSDPVQLRLINRPTDAWVDPTLLCKQRVALRQMFGSAANNHGRCLPVTHQPLLWGNRWGEGKLSSRPGFESEDGIASRICPCCVAGTSLAPFDFRGKQKIFWLSPQTPTRGRAVCRRGLWLSDEDIFRKWNTKCSSFGARICSEININIPHRVHIQQ